MLSYAQIVTSNINRCKQFKFKSNKTCLSTSVQNFDISEKEKANSGKLTIKACSVYLTFPLTLKLNIVFHFALISEYILWIWISNPPK